MSVRKL